MDLGRSVDYTFKEARQGHVEQRTLRDAELSLSDYLAGFQPPGLPLGLVHCTPVVRGIRAINSGTLQAEQCPVYRERLVYLFYGRPAFKPLAGVDASRLDEHLPLCLVFDAALMAKSERMLPFDSGGFARYAGSIGSLSIESFELPADPQTPPKIVAAFYESNLNYFRQMPSTRPDQISLLYPEARAVARLANDETIFDDDDRRSTVEIQLADDVQLADSLIAVIGPSILEAEAPVTDLLSRCPNAVLHTYRTYGRQRPLAHAGQLYDLVEDFFRWKALL